MDIHAVRRRLGKPGYHRCAGCNGHSKVWVYDGDDLDERAVEVPLGAAGGRSRTVRYSADLSHYVALCRECAVRVPDDRKVLVRL